MHKNFLQKQLFISLILIAFLTQGGTNSFAQESIVVKKPTITATPAVLSATSGSCKDSSCCGEECPVSGDQYLCVGGSIDVTHNLIGVPRPQAGKTVKSEVEVSFTPTRITYPNQITAGYGQESYSENSSSNIGMTGVYKIGFRLKEPGLEASDIKNYIADIGYPSLYNYLDWIKTYVSPSEKEGGKYLVKVQEGLCSYSPDALTADDYGPYWVSYALTSGTLKNQERTYPGAIMQDIIAGKGVATGSINPNKTQRYAYVGEAFLNTPSENEEVEGQKIEGCLENLDFKGYNVIKDDEEGRKIYLPSRDYVAMLSNQKSIGNRSGPILTGTAEMEITQAQWDMCRNPRLGEERVCPSQNVDVTLQMGQTLGSNYSNTEGYSIHNYNEALLSSLTTPDVLKKINDENQALTTTEELLKNVLVNGYYAITDCEVGGGTECAYADPMYVLTYLLSSMAMNTPDENIIYDKKSNKKISLEEVYLNYIEQHWVETGSTCTGKAPNKLNRSFGNANFMSQQQESKIYDIKIDPKNECNIDTSINPTNHNAIWFNHMRDTEYILEKYIRTSTPKISWIVLHSTAGDNSDATAWRTINSFTSKSTFTYPQNDKGENIPTPSANKCSNYVTNGQGKIYQLYPPGEACINAGNTLLNSNKAISIENAGGGNSYNQGYYKGDTGEIVGTNLTTEQVRANSCVIAKCIDQGYCDANINVVGHMESQAGKVDPGAEFVSAVCQTLHNSGYKQVRCNHYSKATETDKISTDRTNGRYEPDKSEVTEEI